MLFEFENIEDKDQIFDMLPWAMQGHCLSLQKWEPSVGLNVVDFKRIQFWVQIHDLGLEKFNMENAQRIGNSIGRYIETHKEVENKSNSYLHLKVVVDTEKPLMVGFR